MQGRKLDIGEGLSEERQVEQRPIERHDRTCLGQSGLQCARIVTRNKWLVATIVKPPDYGDLVIVAAQPSRLDIQKQNV